MTIFMFDIACNEAQQTVKVKGNAQVNTKNTKVRKIRCINRALYTKYGLIIDPPHFSFDIKLV